MIHVTETVKVFLILEQPKAILQEIELKSSV